MKSLWFYWTGLSVTVLKAGGSRAYSDKTLRKKECVGKKKHMHEHMSILWRIFLCAEMTPKPGLRHTTFCESYTTVRQLLFSTIKVWNTLPDLQDGITVLSYNLLPTQASNKKGRTGCDGLCINSWEKRQKRKRTGKWILAKSKMMLLLCLVADSFFLGWGIDESEEITFP